MELVWFLFRISVIVGVVCASNTTETPQNSTQESPQHDDDVLLNVPMLPLDEYNRAKGNPLLFPRIVGGSQASLGEFPGKVSLQNRNGFHFCGGTIIDSQHVITAAHCVTNSKTGKVNDPATLQVMGDDLLITAQGSASRQVRRVSHIFVHTKYNLQSMINDVAVLRVTPHFQMTSTFYPTLVLQGTPSDGTQCSVAGWGAQYENGTASARLLRIDVDIISRAICNRPSSYGGFVRAGMICAGTMLGGRDTCQGDSGGGLICNGRLSGIVSFGYGCAKPNFPGIYADASYQSAFISSAVMWSGNHTSIPVPTTVRPGSAVTNSISTTLIIVMAVSTLLCVN